MALCLVLTAVWEFHWRGQQLEPAPQNSNGLWAAARRQVRARPDATVVMGSSRILFDTDLDEWERVTGTRPIQLAIEGTSGRVFLGDLAKDPEFRGFAVVGVTPGLFFAPFMGFRADVIEYAEKESPSQRFGQFLSLQLERGLAFLDSDTKLFTQLERLAWPHRPGMRPPVEEPRKLMVMDETRNTWMWGRVENDAGYQQLARDIWRGLLEIPRPPPPPEAVDEAITAVAADVETIRARGGEVVFVRPPSSGFYLEKETREQPRASTWDRLLETCDAKGVHFADHAELAAMVPPEWSHLAAADRQPFTRTVATTLEPTYRAWRNAR